MAEASIEYLKIVANSLTARRYCELANENASLETRYAGADI